MKRKMVHRKIRKICGAFDVMKHDTLDVREFVSALRKMKFLVFCFSGNMSEE